LTGSKEHAFIIKIGQYIFQVISNLLT